MISTQRSPPCLKAWLGFYPAPGGLFWTTCASDTLEPVSFSGKKLFFAVLNKEIWSTKRAAFRHSKYTTGQLKTIRGAGVPINNMVLRGGARHPGFEGPAAPACVPLAQTKHHLTIASTHTSTHLPGRGGGSRVSGGA